MDVHELGVLLLDNIDIWKPYLADMTMAIQVKLCSPNCPFHPPGTPGGLAAFGFINNTMNTTCRPGGGPARDGVHAPRNDPLIQHAVEVADCRSAQWDEEQVSNKKVTKTAVPVDCSGKFTGINVLQNQIRQRFGFVWGTAKRYFFFILVYFILHIDEFMY